MRRFGAFEGVFTPTLLTILGVIMYLRLGWVVGSAGLGGALLIIFLANTVSLSTALAMSTLATNMKVGAGGAYYLISRSLGLEVGSAIGIPLYLSQALGGAMYIIGFTEAWTALFPGHPFKVTASIVLIALTCLSVFSAKLAMKFQFLIMAMLAGSLVSIFLGEIDTQREIVLWSSSGETPFWAIFAIFFPAVTGIEAGAAMSGEVKDPAKSIPRGMLSAVLVSMVIYVSLAVWLYFLADGSTLRGNYTVLIDVAKWKIAVVAGILGATLSSALGSLLGAPRTLSALGQDKALPFWKTWSLQTKRGEPWFALLVTACLIAVCIWTADLNTIAPLLTMFFLITYGMVNTVVSVEQGLGILSFRPIFKVPPWITWIGALWCFVIMFLIHPLFAGVAFLCTLGIYILQAKRGIHAQWGDVRAGLFTALAEWALKISIKLPKSAKIWKPNLLILVERVEDWKGNLELIHDLAAPHGTVRFLSIHPENENLENKFQKLFKRMLHRNREPETDHPELPMPPSEEKEQESATEKELTDLCLPLKKRRIFASRIVINAHHFSGAFNTAMQTMQGSYFPPNILLLSSNEARAQNLESILGVALRENLGVMLFSQHGTLGLGLRKKIHIWMDSFRGDPDLLLLTGYQISKFWEAETHIIHPLKEPADREQAERILRQIGARVRMPHETLYRVVDGTLEEALEKEKEPADLNLFTMSLPPKWQSMGMLAEGAKGSCIFIRGSGKESINV